MSDRSPVLLRGAMPAAMAPGRANGLYVVVVGEGECRPFLRGRSEQPYDRVYSTRCRNSLKERERGRGGNADGSCTSGGGRSWSRAQSSVKWDKRRRLVGPRRQPAHLYLDSGFPFFYLLKFGNFKQLQILIVLGGQHAVGGRTSALTRASCLVSKLVLFFQPLQQHGSRINRTTASAGTHGLSHG